MLLQPAVVDADICRVMKLFGRRQPADDEPVDLNQRSPQLGLRYKDLLLLHQLIGQGADLTEPRHVLYFLYFDTAEQADIAASRLRDADNPPGDDRRVEVQPTPDSVPNRWSVVLELITALEPAVVVTADDNLQSLADELGGEYDAWEASVVTMTSLP